MKVKLTMVVTLDGASAKALMHFWKHDLLVPQFEKVILREVRDRFGSITSLVTASIKPVKEV